MPPSSSGPGHQVFSLRIAGSNPAGGTTLTVKSFIFTFFVPLFFLFDLFLSYRTQTVLGFGNLLLGILGALASLGGIILWTWGVLSLGTSFAVLPKAKKLKTGGAYRFFKHPIYIGIGLTCLGLSLGLGSLWGLIFTLTIIISLNLLRSRKEEKELEKKFGKQYLDYCRKTI